MIYIYWLKERFSWFSNCVNESKLKETDERKLEQNTILPSEYRNIFLCALGLLSILITVAPFVVLIWMMHACVWAWCGHSSAPPAGGTVLSVCQSVCGTFLIIQEAVCSQMELCLCLWPWGRWKTATTEATVQSIQIHKPHRLKTVTPRDSTQTKVWQSTIFTFF